MLVPVLLFAFGLVLLIKCGDWFVDGAAGIAERFHLPDIIIGATVVSIGTTLPEVMVSTTGAIQGLGSMAYGNAIGSIICNTALIAAISITANPGPVNRDSMKVPVLFFFIAAGIYIFAAYITGTFTRPMGLVMLLIFVIYMLITVRLGFKNPESQEGGEQDSGEPQPLYMQLLLLVAGAAGIAWGANLLVNNGTIIAHALNIPETVIALTFVALGTSLPELVTTITSLKKGHAQLGIGNVIGANLFNLVLVSGLSVAIAPFDVPVGKMIAGSNASLIVDIPIMLFVMLFLSAPPLLTGKLKRSHGIILLCIYTAYCVFQFVY